MFRDPRSIRLRSTFLAPDEGSGGAGTGDGSSETGDAGGAGTGDGSSETGAAESDDPEALKADVAKWKALSQKNEKQAKANASAAKELEKLKRDGMSETDRAVAEAEARGRQTATAEVAQKLAAAEIRVALHGVVKDPSAIVEDLNLAKYVTDAGDVDTDEVAKLRERFVAQMPAAAAADLKQGQRGGAGPAQLTRDDLQKMSPDEIDKARLEGRCNDLLGIKT